MAVDWDAMCSDHAAIHRLLFEAAGIANWKLVKIALTLDTLYLSVTIPLRMYFANPQTSQMEQSPSQRFSFSHVSWSLSCFIATWSHFSPYLNTKTFPARTTGTTASSKAVGAFKSCPAVHTRAWNRAKLNLFHKIEHVIKLLVYDKCCNSLFSPWFCSHSTFSGNAWLK